MDQAYFRAFAERCRELMRRARSEAARDQLYLWAEEFEARADAREESGEGRPAAERVARGLEPGDQRFVAGADARLALVEGLAVGVADMHRQAQIDLAVTGMPGFVVGLAIGLQIRLQPHQRAAAHRHE